MNFADQSHKKSATEGAPASSVPSVEALVGRDEAALVVYEQTRFHRGMITAVERLSEAARSAGFSLCIASGYRSFEQQLGIWAAKASGVRPVLDQKGRPLQVERLDEVELVHAILRWSALPGASRHHWGTDLDVYDASALAAGERLQLTQHECDVGGPMHRFHQWLTGYLDSADNPGFYRPYDKDRGGVAPEPWHLSYAPLANVFARALTLERLHECLESDPIPLSATVMAHLPTLFERYVRVPPGPEGDSSR